MYIILINTLSLKWTNRHRDKQLYDKNSAHFRSDTAEPLLLFRSLRHRDGVLSTRRHQVDVDVISWHDNPPPTPNQNQLLCRKTFALMLTSRPIQNFTDGKSELESCVHLVLYTQCTRVWFYEYILVNCCLKQVMFRDFYFMFTFKTNKFNTLLWEHYPSRNRKTIPFIKTLIL